jgi:excisionase family DNA binding protein
MHSLPINPLPAVMTTEEVAAFFRCSEDTVARYVHRHELVAIQVGKERRFRAEDVLEFVARRPSIAKTA